MNAFPAMMTKGIWKIAKAAKYRRAKENFNVFKPRLCLGLFKSNFIYFGFFFFPKNTFIKTCTIFVTDSEGSVQVISLTLDLFK